MGIKELWRILDPFCERRPLYELQGKTVAVDLSCWICEAQNVADYQVQPRMYLRNLYFRTCYLLLMDVNPIFVLEGKAPELKYDTISARNAIQFKGAKPKGTEVKTGKDRSRFHFVLKQCEEMLTYMGLVCVKGKGEAESLCAYLNEDGLVDGCISQDSDCFAYGARVVYRNFSISTQGTQATSGGSMDVYDIHVANERLKDFGRNKIVAMALLIGCDYSEGIHGIGKASVVKFLETVSNDKVLDRIRSWKDNSDLYKNYEKQLNDKNICTSCGHNGKVQSHAKNGCLTCRSAKGCDSHIYKEQRLNMKNEVAMRNKAIQDPNFPDETLIQEFLVRKDNVKKLDLKWKQPNLVQFVKFAVKFLQWEELYAFEKILPILTRWQCRNPDLLTNDGELKGVLKPERIKKVRNPKGVPSYEIVWTDSSGEFKGLFPESQESTDVDKEKLWSTIEPQDLVQKSYPGLVEAFRQQKLKPKKSRSKRKNIEDLTEKMGNVSLTQPESKKTKKLAVNKTKKKTDLKIMDFFTKDINSDDKGKKHIDNVKKSNVSSKPLAATQELPDLSMPENSTPVKNFGNSLMFDPDMSSFGEDHDFDLSDIIDEIVSKKSDLAVDLKQVAQKYVKRTHVADEIIDLDDSPKDQNRKYNTLHNNASFFVGHPTEDEEDLFELDFNRTQPNFLSSGSDTEDYDFVDHAEQQNKESEERLASDDDSLCDKNYIPLYERLKMK